MLHCSEFLFVVVPDVVGGVDTEMDGEVGFTDSAFCDV